MCSVQLALVIPTEALEESLCINLQIGSLILDKLKASDLHAGSSKTVFQDFVFTKEIDIKGITMSMGFIPTPIQRTDFEYIFENSHGMFQTFVNPCGAVSVWKGMKEKDSDIHIKSIKTLQISLMVKNVEITPSVHQLVSVKEVADYLKNECIKRKFTSLRKALGIQKTIHRFKKRRFNAREMWMFATNAVLIILRERGGYTFSPSLRTGLLRLGLRRIYRQLYTKVIEIRLGLVKCEDAEIIIPPDNSNSRNLAEAYSDYGLSWSEQKKFDDLHRLFSVKELVFFRGLVHHQLQRKGFTRAELLTAIVGKPKKSQWSFYGLSFFSDNVHVEKGIQLKMLLKF